MTQSLTERLAERLATQSAEIEALTTSELARLGQSLRSESEAALSSMRSAMAESMASTTASLTRDLDRLKRLGRWWWGTLLLSWATIAMLMAFSLWLWMSPPTTTARLSGMGVDPVFTAEGRTYLLLPQGSQALQCRQGQEQWVPCVALPGQAQTTETSSGPSLGPAGGTGVEQASEAPASAGRSTTRGEAGGRLRWPPAQWPPTRPDGS